MPRRSATAPGAAAPTRSRPPYDVRAALDELGRDVLAGGRACATRCATCCAAASTAAAGSTSCAAQIRRMRDAARRRGDLGRHARPGPRGRSTRRSPPSATQLAGEDDDDARLGRDGARHAARRRRRRGAGAGDVRLALATRPARTYEPIREMLRDEVLDAAVRRHEAGARGGRDDDPQAHAARSGTCSPTSTACWRRTRAARTPPTSSASSWTSTASSSPRTPRTSTS